MNHPQEDELLRYSDGELPARRSREIRLHLEACWQCRAGLEELQKVISDCVRYRKDLLQIYLPSPPARWGDIYQGFAEIDASGNDVPLFLRVREWLRFRFTAVPRWATAAVSLVLIAAIAIQFLQTPSLQAAELLRKAVAASDARPAKPRLIQIKTSKHQITRRMNTTRSASDSEAAASIQTLFRAARYNWNDPLSVRSYQAWRDGLSDKRDEVTTVNEQLPEQSAYRIRTTSSTGELAQATLTLRVKDLAPLEQRFEFRDHEWMEISELPEDTALTADTHLKTPTIAPPASSTQIAQAAPVSVPERTAPVSVGTELQVFAALHRAGADLGDPIEVTRERDRIVVAGVGIAPQRQEQIHKELEAVPNVVVRFSEPAQAAAQYSQPAPASSGKTVVPTFQSRIEQQLGSRQNFEQFSSQLLDMTDSMMSRAYALRRLADRFSRDAESALTPADRQVLQNLNREHASAIRRQTAQMERLLVPVLTPLAGRPTGTATSGIHSDAWQPATEEVFQNARKLETLLAVMLGVAPGNPSAQLPADVLLSAAQLRASLEAYEQLAIQEPGGK